MIPVVFSTDHNYIMPTTVAIQSLVQCTNDDILHIYILQSENVTDEDRKILHNAVMSKKENKVDFISVGTVFDNVYEIRGISKATYFRLFIPWIIDDWDYIFYLDGDIIVKSSLAPLYKEIQQRRGNEYIYGIRTPGFTTDVYYIEHIKSLNLEPNCYINGGVQILNAKEMRADNLKERMMPLINEQFFFQDQDIINIVCEGRKGFIPLKYNFYNGVSEDIKEKYLSSGACNEKDYDEAIKEPIIIHYAGKKPWNGFTHHWYDWWSVYAKSNVYSAEFEDKITREILNPHYSTKQLIKMSLKQILKK